VSSGAFAINIQELQAAPFDKWNVPTAEFDLQSIEFEK
jgi:hypothetical protein